MIAEVAGTVVLPLVSGDLQRIFIWYVIGLPILLVVLFFITLNFNTLTAADLDNIEADMSASGGAKHPVPALSNAYNLRVAARAAGINYHELMRLSAKDATKLSLLAQNFLVG